ncbi:5'/3'-nucleotidase SurE [Alkaliphilus hydrothermalis]|uniref:5'-nucleotidase SurE n=1 Tax=Alkaliphilus hydrothermalis TaxID=1482730 RepID=A0ABS2NMC9_9FIRM|nr:5'/3'-nucleotidase SurE [Alkaliphilus hydrothermalis]MBM7614088.1 5'-nucleotidase [Alkaliphilus hydrothermalis]
MRIVVTNDDGIFAEGIYHLAKALQAIGEVIVIAPSTEQSAKGHSITLHSPIMVKKIKFFDTDFEAYAVDGTPADCVKLAIEAILKDRRPDIVVSGINNGPNLGTDVIYSGTVSAAVEAAILGVPSIAVSMATTKIDNYDGAANFACKIAKSILHIIDDQSTVFNINYPTCRPESIKGVKVTTLGLRKYCNSFDERKDPQGNSYYWVSGTALELEQNQDSDIVSIKNNYISISPIHFDLTAFNTFQRLKDWSIEL